MPVFAGSGISSRGIHGGAGTDRLDTQAASRCPGQHTSTWRDAEDGHGRQRNLTKAGNLAGCQHCIMQSDRVLWFQTFILPRVYGGR
jgi:hypothetical protein